MPDTNVKLTSLRRIRLEKGDVFHGLKCSEPSFKGFGELYFSSIEEGAIKGWKKHNKVTMNIIVAIGAIRFVIFSSNKDGKIENLIMDEVLGPDINYSRLTIPPGFWVGFMGCGSGLNLLANIIPDEHDLNESENIDLDEFFYLW